MEFCKYCNSKLRKVALPEDNDWGVDFLMVCMNDECGYYKRGWDWMWNHYQVKSSYRFHYNSITGYEGPLHVAKPEDYKNQIITQPDEVEAQS